MSNSPSPPPFLLCLKSLPKSNTLSSSAATTAHSSSPSPFYRHQPLISYPKPCMLQPPLKLFNSFPLFFKSSPFHFYKVSLSIPLLYTLQKCLILSIPSLARSQLIKHH
ncbi:hypothetical protein AAZX31_11G040400 [Glycine max]